MACLSGWEPVWDGHQQEREEESSSAVGGTTQIGESFQAQRNFFEFKHQVQVLQNALIETEENICWRPLKYIERGKQHIGE